MTWFSTTICPCACRLMMILGRSMVTAVLLCGRCEAMPVAGIMRSVIMMKNTSRKSMMSIMLMISILPFFFSTKLFMATTCLDRALHGQLNINRRLQQVHAASSKTIHQHHFDGFHLVQDQPGAVVEAVEQHQTDDG